MEFGEHVVFESDGFCPRCDELEHKVFELGLDGSVDFYSAGLIKHHPDKLNILVELGMQDGVLPVCVFAGKAVGLEEFEKHIERLAEERRVSRVS